MTLPPAPELFAEYQAGASLREMATRYGRSDVTLRKRVCGLPGYAEAAGQHHAGRKVGRKNTQAVKDFEEKHDENCGYIARWILASNAADIAAMIGK